MALKATIFKADLDVSDMDRQYYATHSLTVARHPSETDDRMMVRLVAFALHAHERLELGQRMSDTDEPDLVLNDLTGAIDLWIDVGQPDEARLRKACGRAKHVRVYTYSGHAARKWWEESAVPFERFRNLSVSSFDASAVAALGKLASPRMSLQCMIQDGSVIVVAAGTTVEVPLQPLRGEAATS